MAENEKVTRHIFSIDIPTLKAQSEPKQDPASKRNQVSNAFRQFDMHFLENFAERKDLMRTYRDIPIALVDLYKPSETDYVKDRHGNDMQVTIEGFGGNISIQQASLSTKKRRRQVTLVQDSFSAQEEAVFERLHQSFATLAEEFGGKTIYEITDVFMKVSGDLDQVRKYLQRDAKLAAGEELDKTDLTLKVREWTYIEDIALSMPETSAEFRELLMKKGKDQIEKRKFFLLSTGNVTQAAPPATKTEDITKMEIC